MSRFPHIAYGMRVRKITKDNATTLTTVAKSRIDPTIRDSFPNFCLPPPGYKSSSSNDFLVGENNTLENTSSHTGTVLNSNIRY